MTEKKKTASQKTISDIKNGLLIKNRMDDFINHAGYVLNKSTQIYIYGEQLKKRWCLIASFLLSVLLTFSSYSMIIIYYYNKSDIILTTIGYSLNFLVLSAMFFIIIALRAILLKLSENKKTGSINVMASFIESRKSDFEEIKPYLKNYINSSFSKSNLDLNISKFNLLTATLAFLSFLAPNLFSFSQKTKATTFNLLDTISITKHPIFFSFSIISFFIVVLFFTLLNHNRSDKKLAKKELLNIYYLIENKH